jgi:hypothetical protein
MPTGKRKQPVETFPLNLTVKQRESLVHATRITTGIKTRIKEVSLDQKFVEFTRNELEKMREGIGTSLNNAPPAHRKGLYAVIDKIYGLLAEIEAKHLAERRQAVATSGSIYQFKVTLKESDPPIWRRIHVPDCTLGQLHEVLQVVMGWEDCHLHQFDVRGESYGPLDPEDAHWDMEKDDEEEMSISQIIKMGRKVRFTYEYDFGDSWQHEIVLEKTLEPEPKVRYPRCIEGERACPPEDCGGVWGYAEFLEAVADPMHESHEDMLEWIGGGFDPKKFSIVEVNKELRKYR